MSKKIILFLLLLVAKQLSAQTTTPQHSLNISLGYTSILNKDLYRSPYLYKGVNPVIGVSYERLGRNAIQQVEITYTSGSIKTSFSPLASSKSLSLDYKFLPRIYQSPKTSLYLGANLGAFTWIADYFPDIETAKTRSDILAVSFKIAARADFHLSEKSSLSIQASFPVSSYVNRPNFLDQKNRSSEFGLLNMIALDGKITYGYQFTQKWQGTIGYQYSYYKYKHPATVQMLQNGLSLGIKYSF